MTKKNLVNPKKWDVRCNLECRALTCHLERLSYVVTTVTLQGATFVRYNYKWLQVQVLQVEKKKKKKKKTLGTVPMVTMAQSQSDANWRNTHTDVNRRIHSHIYINTVTTMLCEVPAQVLQNLDFFVLEWFIDYFQSHSHCFSYTMRPETNPPKNKNNTPSVMKWCYVPQWCKNKQRKSRPTSE